MKRQSIPRQARGGEESRPISLAVIMCVIATANIASADTFGTGNNQFTIDFVNISGDASSANGTNISQDPPGEFWYRTFTDPGSFRIGKFEISNDQWEKFINIYGIPFGNPTGAYDRPPYFTGTNIPANCVSWYEAAQFVNWLNTSTGHQAAYKFTGTLKTSNYTFVSWEPGDSGYDPSNPFRNSNAFYFLPTEDEWCKAAYWNGTNLQTYATIDGSKPIAGVDTNYDLAVGHQPWEVTSGTEELNGTFNIMGNMREWMEGPLLSGDYLPGYFRGVRGGSFDYYDYNLGSSYRYGFFPNIDYDNIGFRVASVPEPATILLIGLGAVILRRRR